MLFMFDQLPARIYVADEGIYQNEAWVIDWLAAIKQQLDFAFIHVEVLTFSKI